MDESWRMRMGMANISKPSLPRRRSTEQTTRPTIFRESDTGLEPEDFSDVFGGPPRTVLSRQFSAGNDFARSVASSFYDEIFRLPEGVVPEARVGRSLPGFRIPGSQKSCEGPNFYGDIFGSNDGVLKSKSWSRSKSKSKSKSKTSSSSVLSSEELSPLRPAMANDDVCFSLFASKLRPINVPSRWNSSMMIHEEYPRHEEIPPFSWKQASYDDSSLVENEYIDSFRSSHFRFPRRVSSPETISINPNSYGSFRVSVEDVELYSPSSVVSSICQDQEIKVNKSQDEVMQEEYVEQDDEVMSSYVIEINSEIRGDTGEAFGIDEAIAWAKEKFKTHSSEEDKSMRHNEKDKSAEIEERANFDQFTAGQKGGDRSTPLLKDEKLNKWATEEEKQHSGKDVQMELQLLDEGIKFWSAGKEGNICLLLSTLHQILWPNSGWYSVPSTNLTENSHVKKAYQKARLCLHPDKLQQRGATLPQKYVAEKVFSILQDAWTAYISREVLFS